MAAIDLIVGLGNPGRDYEDTRHNAGAWLVEALARRQGCSLQLESKFFGLTGRTRVGSDEVRLLIPTTFMNRSGQAIAALAGFYKIPVESILVVHDELDLPPGVARLKRGGGHGGHNGLRDTIARLGNNANFQRLRLGIGHPGTADQVVGFVLNRPTAAERQAIDAVIDAALDALPLAVAGDSAKAMTQLHSFKV
jgi:PTH1 family peptidyl-tRNA hydrolase